VASSHAYLAAARRRRQVRVCVLLAASVISSRRERAWQTRQPAETGASERGRDRTERSADCGRLVAPPTAADADWNTSTMTRQGQT